MVRRAQGRTAFGKPLSEQGVVSEWVADARIRIEQARLLVLKTAWMIDSVGTKAARTEIAAIKVAAPATLKWVADRAIQLFGAAGFTEDWPLARFYSMARWLQIADGPDEVHRRSVARGEFARDSLRSSL
jgi:acyl-CoA dehydrogenase